MDIETIRPRENTSSNRPRTYSLELRFSLAYPLDAGNFADEWS
jgi:hypothetical protein